MEAIEQCELSQLFDGKTMWRTLINMTKPDASTMDLYDPDMVLRLLSNVIKHNTKLNCKEFVKINGLSFAFASTSFSSEDRRVQAYSILSRFLRKLKDESAHGFVESNIYVFLITMFKHSITENNPQMPHVISHFFARVSKLILVPADAAYAPIMAFLSLKPIMNLRTVPEFVKMFFSTSTAHFADERTWMLRLCSQAMINARDYDILSSIYVLEACQMLFYSNISDFPAKNEALRLFLNCARIRSAAVDMFRRMNFTTWIVEAVQHPFTTETEAIRLADIFSLIVYHVYHNKKDVDDRKKEKPGYALDHVVQLNGQRLCTVLRNKVKEEDAERLSMLQRISSVIEGNKSDDNVLEEFAILPRLLSYIVEVEELYNVKRQQTQTVS